MTLSERIRAGFFALETDQVPLHCRIRMAPLSPEYQWVRDLGWGVVASHSCVKLHYRGCRDVTVDCQVGGRPCKRRTVETPKGTLTSLDTINAAGGRAPLEPLFKSSADYPALLSMIDSMSYEPSYDGFSRLKEKLGEWGYPYTWAGYDPMHEIMIKMMNIEIFSFQWADYQEDVLELYYRFLDKHRQMFGIMSNSPAELIIYGGNIQPNVVGRERFMKYYLPVHREFGELLHPSGKRIGAHMDDSTGHLADLIAQCPWDVMEAFAVAPDGDMTVAESMDAWQNRVISLNFPSKLHHAGDDEIRSAVRQFIDEAGSTNRLLISFTEDFPREVEAKLFTVIGETVQSAR